MESVGIIEKVPLNEPADWMSNLVCVDKPDGSIRLFMYAWILGILMLLSKEKTNHSVSTVFSTLDAEKAFYQIQLDEETSRLLTLNTPFGRYGYLRR